MSYQSNTDFNHILALFIEDNLDLAYDCYIDFDNRHCVNFTNRLSASKVVTCEFKFDLMDKFLELSADIIRGNEITEDRL